jgi:TonB family protein
MHKLIYLKKFLPFFLAMILHVIIFSFFIDFKPPITNSKVQPLQFKKLYTISLNNMVSKKSNISKMISPNNHLVNNEAYESHDSVSLINVPVNPNSKEGPENNFDFYEEPIYPKMARLKQIEGFVKVQISFNDEGLVQNAKIIDSSHSKVLEDSVLVSISKWRMKKNNAMTIVKNFEFKLNP